MTKKDFFILLVKIFGLFSVVTNLFSVLPSSISFVSMDFGVFGIFWIIFVITLVISLFILLIYKSDKVVSLLKLEKGFDDDRIDFGNLKSTDIIKIGTFIIGGLVIINTIPIFLNHTLFAFKENIVGETYNPNDKFDWLMSCFKLIIGYLLITNLEFVAKLFTKEKTSKR